ncbi:MULTISPECIES: hypothetical protein [Paenibacillus]|jgi:hypothetical protein|uniref:Uncharacterized protein n=1 Tax=Paenibacillus azoreducens TaxID=116718 RepID=A0A919YIS6_9BACL|nr:MULTISPECIES: hypothetical protein [Paenibacillus]MBE9913593.1 hypothetical protein [Paenibacillus donghaensis]GIO51254.1 hypothetical protein J34TS1_60190 [Paenibacillus azoreducens]
MEFQIIKADMSLDEEKHYLGHVTFSLAGHQTPYEITLFSKKQNQWDYSLNFSGDSGVEEEFLKADELLEEDDDLFDALVDAALDTMKQ